MKWQAQSTSRNGSSLFPGQLGSWPAHFYLLVHLATLVDRSSTAWKISNLLAAHEFPDKLACLLHGVAFDFRCWTTMTDPFRLGHHHCELSVWHLNCISELGNELIFKELVKNHLQSITEALAGHLDLKLPAPPSSPLLCCLQLRNPNHQSQTFSAQQQRS